MNTDHLIKVTASLSRCLSLIDGYDRKSVMGDFRSMYLSICDTDGFGGPSYEFDREASNYLMPFLKLFLDRRKKELEAEIVSLLKGE